MGTLLKEDAGRSLDEILFSSTAAIQGVPPAGLLNGVAPITAATVPLSEGEVMLQDLQAAAGGVVDAESSGATRRKPGEHA